MFLYRFLYGDVSFVRVNEINKQPPPRPEGHNTKIAPKMTPKMIPKMVPKMAPKRASKMMPKMGPKYPPTNEQLKRKQLPGKAGVVFFK